MSNSIDERRFKANNAVRKNTSFIDEINSQPAYGGGYSGIVEEGGLIQLRSLRSKKVGNIVSIDETKHLYGNNNQLRHNQSIV